MEIDSRLDLNSLPTERLLRLLAKCARQERSQDLDLLSSCRRINAFMAKIVEAILGRMDGDKKANTKLITRFMDRAVAMSADDYTQQRCKDFLGSRQQILDNIEAAPVVGTA